MSNWLKKDKERYQKEKEEFDLNSENSDSDSDSDSKSDSSNKSTKRKSISKSDSDKFLNFCKQTRESVVDENNDWDVKKVTKELKKMWEKMDNDEKNEY